MLRIQYPPFNDGSFFDINMSRRVSQTRWWTSFFLKSSLTSRWDSLFWMLELEELTLSTRIKRENNSSSSCRMRLKFRHCKTKHFNKIGKFVDVKLEELGAKRVHELGLSDDDANLEDDFITWKEAFWTSVCAEFDIEASSEDFNTRQYEHKVLEEGGYKPEKLYTGEVARLRSYVTQRPPFDVKNPYMAPIKVNKNIHNDGSDRHCMHTEVDIEG